MEKTKLLPEINLDCQLELLTENGGTRFHQLKFAAAKVPIRILETREEAVLLNWLDVNLSKKKKNDQLVCFSFNPKKHLITSIHLFVPSTLLIFRPTQGLPQGLPQRLPPSLQNLFENLSIRFLGYDMVRRKVKQIFAGQFEFELKNNFTFLNWNDHKINWKDSAIESFITVLKLKNEKTFGSKQSCKWGSDFLPQDYIINSTLELLLAHEATKFIQ
ncbi:hypothetical protein MKW92_034102, partial [Papaver armeniacum]